MNILSIITTFFVIVPLWIFGQNTTQEIVLVGDMHQLPKIYKGAYKPMFKKLSKYNADAVFMEAAFALDTNATGVWNNRFRQKHLESKESYSPDLDKISVLESTDNRQLTLEDFAELSKYYLWIGDQANYAMYRFLYKFGFESFKSYGSQTTDLTFELFRHFNHKKIYGVDNHHGYNGYYKHWKIALSKGSSKGRRKYRGMLVSDFFSRAWHGLFGTLGKQTNKPRSFERDHKINTLEMPGFQGAEHAVQLEKFNNRNSKMAANICYYLKHHGFQKSIYVVGSGHIKGIRDELQRQNPNLKVVLYNEL